MKDLVKSFEMITKSDRFPGNAGNPLFNFWRGRLGTMDPFYDFIQFTSKKATD